MLWNVSYGFKNDVNNYVMTSKGRRDSPEVACWTSDQWVTGSNHSRTYVINNFSPLSPAHAWPSLPKQMCTKILKLYIHFSLVMTYKSMAWRLRPCHDVKKYVMKSKRTSQRQTPYDVKKCVMISKVWKVRIDIKRYHIMTSKSTSKVWKACIDIKRDAWLHKLLKMRHGFKKYVMTSKRMS